MRAYAFILVAVVLFAGCAQRATLVPRDHDCLGMGVSARWDEPSAFALLSAAPKAGLVVEASPMRDAFGVIRDDAALEAISWRPGGGDAATLFADQGPGFILQVSVQSGGVERAVELARGFAERMDAAQGPALDQLLDDVRRGGSGGPPGKGSWHVQAPWHLAVDADRVLAETADTPDFLEPYPGAIQQRHDEWLLVWRAPTWILTDESAEAPVRIVLDTRERITAETFVLLADEPFPTLQERVNATFARAGLVPSWSGVTGGSGSC